ncbi:hypothetical protein GCM10023257_71380 [Streptomyces hyderabadensis]|uniref:Uncharacterized protein n=1 Tax=Streptomyces hyderabadensis TaxID=598549 RepID=A0ABP9IX66_9ACTN
MGAVTRSPGNTCSVTATAGLPQRALYSASKGAVQSLTLAMAGDDIHEGIRGCRAGPGSGRTGPWPSWPPGEERESRPRSGGPGVTAGSVS